MTENQVLEPTSTAFQHMHQQEARSKVKGLKTDPLTRDAGSYMLSQMSLQHLVFMTECNDGSGLGNLLKKK